MGEMKKKNHWWKIVFYGRMQDLYIMEENPVKAYLSSSPRPI